MIIQKMTATFGRLDRAALEPGPGLTVISAPNEGGKSTWAGFLRAMLYGISTRERDKEGYLAEKNRYAPWSGAPMEGELRLNWRGRDITLRRFAKKNSPFGGFEAVYTASGDPVSELTGENAGQLLVGAGREMYERSAFVGQGGAAVAGGGELEARIAALATAGEEDVSYTGTARILKDWRNRRRANKANGLLPELEAEIARTGEAADAVEQARQACEEAGRRAEELERERGELEAELELHRRIQRQDLDRRYARARADWQQALAAVPASAPHPVFGAMTAEEAWALAQERVAARTEAEEENRRRAQARTALEQGRKKQTAALIFGAAVCVLALVLSALCLLLRGPVLTLTAMAVLFAGGIARCVTARRGMGRTQEEWQGLAPVEVPDPGDILEQARAYGLALAQTEQARQTAEAKKKLVDELAAQGGRELTTLEFLQPPARSREETAARLAAVTAELSRTRRTLDMALGRRNTLGEADALYARLDGLNARRAERQREYDALTVAMEALSAANDTLRERFSPALNAKAGELFARLTGGKYAALGLTRSFEASATPAGELLPRSALALSRGTVEQLYLAVRLAVCELTLGGEEPPPLVLDDALADFDDRRMELALDLLRELGEGRQILLFTCHSREADWAETHGVDVCRLQSAEV